MCKKISIVLFIVFVSYAVNSQPFTAKYLGIEDGLSNNVITAIFQDHNGFMWFGTYDGLNRYDGYSFKIFRNVIGDSNSINSNNINKIEEDKQHNIWIGCQRDLSIYNPVTAKFSTPVYNLFNGQQVRSIHDNVLEIKMLDKNCSLIGTEHNGLFYFENADTGKQVAITENGKQFTGYYVSALEYNAAKNTAYVFVLNHGLFIYNLKTHQLTEKNNSIQNANCLKLDRHGKLWVGESNGLHVYDDFTNTFSESYVTAKSSVTNISEDSAGRLWIATDGSGVLILNKNGKQAVPLSSLYNNGSELINSNSVYAIYEDAQQRKWIGTLRGGINILEPKNGAFTKVVYGEGKANISPVQNFIFSFCEDDKDHVWIGTDGAGLRYWNRNNNTFENYVHNSNNASSVSDDFITSIVKDVNNDMWLTTWFGGINKFNRLSKTFTHYTCFNTRTKLMNNHGWFVFSDSRNRLWASTVRSGGLYQFNYQKNAFEEFDNNLAEIQCMDEDANGNIWCGDYSSLIKIDTLHKHHKYYNIGYAVRSIYEDKQHNFWIGTQEGGLLLFNRNTNSLKRFTTQQGLPSNTILRILEDRHGNLWLSTFNGLSKMNVQTKTFSNFSQADGLQSNQFSFNGAYALSNGEFLFGGIKGFNIFYPDSIIAGVPKRQLFLSSLKINNDQVENNPQYVTERNFEQIRKLVIPYNQASLALNFLALDYKEASGLNYAYILKGWDKNWNYVNNTRIANYSRLYEGDYFFEVKVSGPDGVWGKAQQLLQIHILPPWYRTWWAYVLYVSLGASLVYLYVWYKNRQAKLQYEVQLAHLETQKEKELNVKKINFFTNISHEFRAPLSLIINPVKDLLHKTNEHSEKAELKVVYRNAQRLLRLVDQLLLFKKADEETDNLHLSVINFCNLCNDVFSYFLEQARSKKITYQLLYAEEIRDLNITADREKIEIAFFNILSNAFKYTPSGGEIIFRIEESASFVMVKITDSGSGIETAAGNKIFERFYQSEAEHAKTGFGIGLFLVKNFVESHNGKVYYESEKGKGAIFTIELSKNFPDNLTLTENKIVNSEKAASEVKDASKIVFHIDNTFEKNGTQEPAAANVSEILREMNEDVPVDDEDEMEPGIPEQLASDKQSLLIIDDDDELRNYLASTFKTQYKTYVADSAETGIELARKQLPDLIISDIFMKAVNGIELCKILKEDKTVSHIPIILLTGSSSSELQLEGIKSGADDFIKKPFDKDILFAKVSSILKRRNALQNYFYNEITLGNRKFKVSPEYKEFLEQCMRIIDDHLTDDTFSIKILASEIGMSHSALYKKIKTVSGQSINGFIRFVRLKKAAEIFINTENNVNETANIVGFYDVKYFRRQFANLFGINPSEYIKKFRKRFHNNQNLEEKVRK
jgi:signal transduction histidine kinase/ligand-binding sensor domain-containing protein/AraC-like DNA-binding protein